MNLLLDTGNSDTWAIQQGFSCVDHSSSRMWLWSIIPATFQYGETFPPQHMFIRYGNGEVVMGPMGFFDITVGKHHRDEATGVFGK